MDRPNMVQIGALFQCPSEPGKKCAPLKKMYHLFRTHFILSVGKTDPSTQNGASFRSNF